MIQIKQRRGNRMRAYQHAQVPPDDEGHPAHAFYSRAELMNMHAKFCRAMINARKAGKEKFTIGMVTNDDDRDLVPTPFSRIQRGSEMGSSASMMADDAPMGGYARSTSRAWLGARRE
jgi:hypothetical protein